MAVLRDAVEDRAKGLNNRGIEKKEAFFPNPKIINMCPMAWTSLDSHKNVKVCYQTMSSSPVIQNSKPFQHSSQLD